MFVEAKIRLSLDFETARARLARLTHGAWLRETSTDAYGELVTGLARVGPLGPAAIVSRLVEVRFRELVVHEDHAVLTLRWEAVGSTGGLFPVLDADVTVARAGAQVAMLSLLGSYRPPLGLFGAGLDRVVLSKIAAATVRKFMTSIGDVLTDVSVAAEPVAGDPVPMWSWVSAPETSAANG